VYDPKGLPEKLGKKTNSGGEGSIWTLESPKLANAVVKLFHPQKLAERGFADHMEKKIRAMNQIDNDDQSMAWPRFSVYNKNRQFIGFVMRRVEGKELSMVMHPLASKPLCRGWNRGQYIRLALDLAMRTKTLHQKGIVLGDINPNNFLAHLSQHSLCFIDTDSYQFSSNGKTYRCLVGMPEYTPPEYQGLSFRTFDRTRESDHFALAVLIFQILMRGKHPFDIVGGEGPVQNIKRGNFPYGTNQAHLIPKGAWIRLWSHLPRRIKTMFHKAFIDGVKKPSARPSPDDWTHVLRVYLSDAMKGWHELSLTPVSFKNREYQGKRPLESSSKGGTTLT
jgi:DNA-binding helix-hairpin-helix protein with protein kinase domain